MAILHKRCSQPFRPRNSNNESILYYANSCDVAGLCPPNTIRSMLQDNNNDESVTTATGILLNRKFVPNGTMAQVHRRSPHTKFLHLYRSNIVKQGISNMIRLKTAVEVPNNRNDNSTLFQVDPLLLESEMLQTVVANREFQNSMASEKITSYVNIVYEQLQIDTVKTPRSVFRQLGPEWERRYSPHVQVEVVALKKKASESVCDDLVNCDELLRFFKDSPCIVSQLKSTTVQAWSAIQSLSDSCTPISIEDAT